MVNISVDLLSVGAKNRPGYAMTPKYITVHNTGNTAKGADALAHATFLKNSKETTGWHFTVDDKRIIQHIPCWENAWHATDGHGPGNMQSIGIEICVNSDGNYAKAEANAVELIRYLMSKYSIPVTNVVPHQKWYPVKYCPYKILPRWNEFINEIKQPDKVTYTVVAGDNLSKIAAKYGLSLAAIKGANSQIKDFSLIHVGDKINIPLS